MVKTAGVCGAACASPRPASVTRSALAAGASCARRGAPATSAPLYVSSSSASPAAAPDPPASVTTARPDTVSTPGNLLKRNHI